MKALSKFSRRSKENSSNKFNRSNKTEVHNILMIYKLAGVHMHILVSGSRDKEIRIWNTVTAQCLATYTGHDNWVNGVTMHHDNLHLYSVGDDRTIRVRVFYYVLQGDFRFGT